MNITTVNPYVSWSVSEQLDLWASVGYGRGERHLKPKDGATTSKQSDWISLAGGARLQLWQGGSATDRSTDRATAASMQPGTAAALDGGADHNMAPGSGTAASPLTLSLKVEGATAQFMGVDVQQARLATEAQRRFTMDDGVLTTAVELGLRLRSEEAAAMELGGRLTWLHEQTGLSTTAHGRVLLAGGEDHEEWGVGGRLRYQPGNRGEGLNAVLEPSFSDTGSRLADLWALDGSDLALRNDEAPEAQLRGELSYGIFRNAGILTPYSNLVLTEGNSTIGLGLRYLLPSSLQLDLRGEQQHANDGATDHRIGLQLQTPL